MDELKPPFTVVCINDKNRPKEIPATKWITFGEQYTVTNVGKTMDNQIGFVLAERELGEDTFPYDLFSAKRFALLAGVVSTAEETAEEVVEDLITETLG
jgi:hypothetical protein